MDLIRKILIANRGEIAIRIARAAKEMEIEVLTVFSEADRDSAHVKCGDESCSLGSGTLADTYLNIDKIIEIAKSKECQAVHPGYGFLAENFSFAEACKKNRMIFIGPRPEVIKLMGNKLDARAFVKKIGAPVTPGFEGQKNELLEKINEIEFPVLIKAAAGGGGKGMRIAGNREEFVSYLDTCSREAKNYFGDETVYVEKYLESPRHIEVQILGDNYGNIIHLFERECSVQRRYQKIIEEAPAPGLNEITRKAIHESAVKIAKAAGYTNAGTIEFLLDKNNHHFFLEMNTRVQVEHPVTEMITGRDIVKEQIKIAGGEELKIKQENICSKGHSIECRIYAEDTENNFQPSPGQITFYKQPDIESIRIDSSINRPIEIKSQFDPMISKVITYGQNRAAAIDSMKNALAGYKIFGIKTNISFLYTLLSMDDFQKNRISTKYCEEKYEQILAEQSLLKLKNDYSRLKAIGTTFSLIHQNGPANLWQEIGYWRNRAEIPIRFMDEVQVVELKKIDSKKFCYKFEYNELEIIDHSYNNNFLQVEIDGEISDCYVQQFAPGKYYLSDDVNVIELWREDVLDVTHENIESDDAAAGNIVRSDIPGRVIKVSVKKGDKVKKGNELLIIEAMKMENSLRSTKDSVVKEIKVVAGQQVESNTELIILE